MGTLIFVGAGLGSASYLSVAAVEQLRGCDEVFIEEYTGFLASDFAQSVERLAGKTPVRLGREEVERGRKILEASMRGKVALLCSGDPMAATTHISLRIEAHRKGIETRVLHAPSVFTAAPSAAGLQHYRFGRTTTVPRFSEGYRPTSPAEVAGDNFRRGLHSLVLLDTDPALPMTPGEAMDELLEMSAASGGFPSADTFVCVLSRLGMDDESIISGRMGKLRKMDFGHPPHCLIIPSKLHFQEAEALTAFAKASPEDMREII